MNAKSTCGMVGRKLHLFLASNKYCILNSRVSARAINRTLKATVSLDHFSVELTAIRFSHHNHSKFTKPF